MRFSVAQSRGAQRGVSAKGIFIFFFIVFWVMVLSNKIGMPYWNAHIVHEDIVKILEEQGAMPAYDVASIRQSLYNRGQIDNISIAPDSVDIELHDDNSITVTVPYTQSVPMWSGATLVLNLPQSVSRAANKSARSSLD